MTVQSRVRSGSVEVLPLERRLHYGGGCEQPLLGPEESLGEPRACAQIKNIDVEL